VQRTAEKLKWSQQLFDEKYLSGTSCSGQPVGQKAALDMDLATSRLLLLEKFTFSARSTS